MKYKQHFNTPLS